MDHYKQQEIKNVMAQLSGEKPNVCHEVMQGYVFGTYGNGEHYSYGELLSLYDEMILEKFNIPVFAPLLAWYDPTTSMRVVLSDEAVKNIAIDALPLIQYVNQSGLVLENAPGFVKIYVNYVLDEHRAIFEAFGGYVENNPYPTTTALEGFTVAQLNAFKEEHTLEVEGWADMLKAAKIAQLKYIIYGIPIEQE